MKRFELEKEEINKEHHLLKNIFSSVEQLKNLVVSRDEIQFFFLFLDKEYIFCFSPPEFTKFEFYFSQ